MSLHVFWENSATFLESVEKYVHRNDTGLLLRKQATIPRVKSIFSVVYV